MRRKERYSGITRGLVLSLTVLSGCGGGGGSGDNAPSGASLNPPATASFIHTELETFRRSPAFVDVTANDTGQAVAMWRHVEGTESTVWANTYDPQSGWTAAQQLSSTGSIFDTRASVDTNGDVAVVWDESADPPRRVMANTVIGGAVGNITALAPSSSDGERVAAGFVGGPMAIVVWTHLDAIAEGGDVLESTEYRLASGWANPVQIPVLTFEEQAAEERPQRDPRFANITALGNGKRLVVWSTDQDLRASLFESDGGWQAPLVIAAADTDEHYLAAGGNDTALVIWIENANNTEYMLKASWFNGTAWEPPATIDTQTGIILSQDGISVAVDPLGNALVVWEHTAPSRVRTIRSVRYREGRWEPPVFLSNGGADPSLAVNKRGDAAAVWIEGNRVVGRGFVASSPSWSEVVAISIASARAEEPEVFLEPDGRAVVVWMDNDGDTLWGTVGEVK